MEKIRAKFYCKSVVDDTDKKNVVLYPVIAGSVENDETVDYTPSGKILLSVKNPTVAKKFQEGKQYFLDFAEVGK